MTTPRVSVCIPSYNCADYLPEAIESVLNQTFDDFELVIIDDCSTDSSCEIIARYAERDPRIRFSRNGTNLGMVANWNRCMELARGEYIRYLFADDLLASAACLERMSALLDADGEVSLVASARTIIDEHSNILKTVSRFPDGINEDGAGIIRRCLYEGRNLVGEPSVVMFRKSQATRGFNPGYRQLVDLEMWFHLLEQGKFAYIGEPLSSFREHPTQQTRVNLSRMIHIDESLLLLKEYFHKPYVRFGRLTRWYLCYFQNYRVWKLYRQNLIDRKTAEERIAATREIGAFLRMLPFYKALGPLFKLRGLLMRN